MTTLSWRDFLSPIRKKAGANDPPLSVSRSAKGRGALPALASYSPRSYSGPSMRNYGSAPRRPQGGTWLGFKTHDLDEEAKNFQGMSDPYYYNILVGGANAGGNGFLGLSRLPFGVLANGNNRKLFRNGDIKGIKAAIDRSIKDGKHVRVFGHSWGGADVARLAKEYPNVPFYALDPVSWTGRIDEIPENLTIVRPDGSANALDLPRMAQIFGGQWPKIQKGLGKTIVIPGDHVVGFAPWITKLNRDVMDKRMRAFISLARNVESATARR